MDVQAKLCDWQQQPDLGTFAHSNFVIRKLIIVELDHRLVGSKNPKVPELKIEKFSIKTKKNY